MAVFQCACGMVISTPDPQARCIRCGATLGSDDVLDLATPGSKAPNAEGVAGEQGGADDDPAPQAPSTSQPHGVPSCWSTYVSLVLISAARSLANRTSERSAGA
jgi:hypothetical protein